MGFKILLTENASPVGAALFNALENYPHPVFCPDFGLEEWCDEQRVLELLNSSTPAVVINPLHYSAPQAVAEEPRFYQVLASLCAQRNLTVIHLSSSEVFGAAQQLESGASAESVVPDPDSHTGKALLQAELAFGEVRRAVILRLPWLLDSPQGMISAVCRALCAQEPVIASERWRVAPVYVADVVRTVIAMLQQILCGADNWGVFHLHSSDVCSEAEFVDCIARNLSKVNVAIVPVAVSATDEHFFAGNGWLQGSRCTNDFGIQRRSWRKGIKAKVHSWVEMEAGAGRLVVLPEEGG